jgi:pheromone shutdown protein TraB
VEGLKTTSAVNQLTSIMKSELPEVYNALIGERDIFMAEGLAETSNSRTVAVVGFAHLQGIYNYLINHGYVKVSTNCN